MARLIDADALKKEIVDFKLNLHPQNQDYGTGYFSALSVVEGMLAYAPTVDAVPVVHGRWEWLGPYRYNDDGMIGTCSICKERLRIFEHNYCPNCGANMDGGENNA